MALGKSGMEMLMGSLLPGVDFNELVKAANVIGVKVQEMDARILRMESLLIDISMKLTTIENNTQPDGYAAETHRLLMNGGITNG